jgi:uncharacterized protein
VTAGRTLALFVREPEPGAVKTRLAPTLGAEGAALLYGAFLEDLSAKLVGEGEWEAIAVHDGPVPGPVLKAQFGGRWAFLPQGAGDLGARLSRCFRHLAREGDGATVVAGSDVPSLSRRAVSGAFDALEGFRGVAFAPSPDGGFSLVGMPWPVSAGFLEGRIEWSTPAVLAEAVGEARVAGHDARYLPVLPDVDEPKDLDALRELLREDPKTAPATARALNALAGAAGSKDRR